jgi:hypothetical protein
MSGDTNEMDRPKVFGIGFHKTGTTSLAAALNVLGYRVTGPNWVDEPRIAELVHELAFDLVPQYDAFQDNPWPLLYRELDERYPGSKFVLTVRDPQEWMTSAKRHFGAAETSMRRWIYGHGSPLGHEDVYLARYKAHYTEVFDYFRVREQDLLVMDIANGDGWDTLCPFLDFRAPRSPFPHRNQAARREQHQGRSQVATWLRGLLPRQP